MRAACFYSTLVSRLHSMGGMYRTDTAGFVVPAGSGFARGGKYFLYVCGNALLDSHVRLGLDIYESRS